VIGRRARHVAWLLGASVTAAALADEMLTVRLAPAPRDAAMRTLIAGEGAAQVTLAGSALTIAGSFAGLTTPATRAELRQGAAVAVRGPVLHELTVTRATSGSLSGSFTLTPAARAAFDAGQLYIQIASESAPDGSVWGWLLPANAPLVRDR
jgi:hypothetical protein